MALEYYKKALTLEPYRPTLYKNLADIYYLQGNLDQAITLNQRGFTLSQSDYHWPLQLSLLFRENKNLPEAQKYLNQALKLAPDNEELKKYQSELNK